MSESNRSADITTAMTATMGAIAARIAPASGAQEADLVNLTAAVVLAVPAADHADIVRAPIDGESDFGPKQRYSASATLDELHTATGTVADNPARTVLREHLPVRIDDTVSEVRWPQFTAPANACAVGSMLALPLTADGNTIGVLNLYARRPHAFTTDDRALAAVFADTAAAALHTLMMRTEQHPSAVVCRDVIEQAIGLLMARHGLSSRQAPDTLGRIADRRHESMLTTAHRLIGDVPDAAAPLVPGTLRLTRTDTAHVVIVHVHNDIDYRNAPAFVIGLGEVLIAAEARPVVIDLHEVDFISTEGLAALAALDDRAGRGGSPISLTGSYPVQRQVHVLDLGRNLRCYTDHGAATRAARDGAPG
ncbi:GAF domain-containing protein [Antrihabitans cavernicola]|uniref:GAF domain-containing protein n=1 Tax=Antrihabitans cavernicola TaxID=2495913 RepID=UPI001659C695|nr:GAF domain-containing protein [Spelaeibacter cavernicola]